MGYLTSEFKASGNRLSTDHHKVHRLLHQILLPRIILSIRLKPATAPCPTPQAENKLAPTTIDMHVTITFVALARSSPKQAGSLAFTGCKKFCPVCYCYTHGDFLLGSQTEQAETIFRHPKYNDQQEACYLRCAALAFGSRDVLEYLEKECLQEVEDFERNWVLESANFLRSKCGSLSLFGSTRYGLSFVASHLVQYPNSLLVCLVFGALPYE